jgi:hypothetical protein
MSLGDSLFSLASSAARMAGRTVDAVPVPGVVRGAIRGIARAVNGHDRPDALAAQAGAWSAPSTDPVPRPEPAPLRPATAHEPTAASRAEAHGGPAGRHGDDWTDELVEDEAPAPAPQPAGEPATDEPLIDPGAARAVRKEAEVMQRAARPKR